MGVDTDFELAVLSHCSRTQLAYDEYSYIASVLRLYAPCNMLVFGAGDDTKHWLNLNRGGVTVVLENKVNWKLRARKQYRQAREVFGEVRGHVSGVNYTADRDNWRTLLDDRDKLDVVLKDDILNTAWDMIFVDSPNDEVGRMQSIHMASKLAGYTDVFVHDCDRELEMCYCDACFADDKYCASVERLRHYRCERAEGYKRPRYVREVNKAAVYVDSALHRRHVEMLPNVECVSSPSDADLVLLLRVFQSETPDDVANIEALRLLLRADYCDRAVVYNSYPLYSRFMRKFKLLSTAVNVARLGSKVVPVCYTTFPDSKGVMWGSDPVDLQHFYDCWIREEIGRDLLVSFCGCIGRPNRKVDGVLRSGYKLRADLQKSLGGKPDADCVMRQQLWSASNNTVRKSEFETEFFAYLKRSKFTLCPRGLTANSYRIYQAMAMGSIPVICSDDFPFPMSDVVRWEDFSVVVPEKEAEHVYDKLVEYDVETVARMAESAKRAWQEWFAPVAMLRYFVQSGLRMNGLELV